MFRADVSSAEQLPMPRQWAIAAVLAIIGAAHPLPIPVAGIHKLYLGQPRWGGVYLLLGWTQIPRIASAIEGLWFLFLWQQSKFAFKQPVGAPRPGEVPPLSSEPVVAIATALRELEKLRQEGLMSEGEFEQGRRKLLERLH